MVFEKVNVVNGLVLIEQDQILPLLLALLHMLVLKPHYLAVHSLVVIRDERPPISNMVSNDLDALCSLHELYEGLGG